MPLSVSWKRSQRRGARGLTAADALGMLSRAAGALTTAGASSVTLTCRSIEPPARAAVSPPQRCTRQSTAYLLA
jgi:hypothetical protein